VVQSRRTGKAGGHGVHMIYAVDLLYSMSGFGVGLLGRHDCTSSRLPPAA
jgi:hypothetical protein